MSEYAFVPDTGNTTCAVCAQEVVGGAADAMLVVHFPYGQPAFCGYWIHEQCQAIGGDAPQCVCGQGVADMGMFPSGVAALAAEGNNSSYTGETWVGGARDDEEDHQAPGDDAAQDRQTRDAEEAYQQYMEYSQQLVGYEFSFPDSDEAASGGSDADDASSDSEEALDSSADARRAEIRRKWLREHAAGEVGYAARIRREGEQRDQSGSESESESESSFDELSESDAESSFDEIEVYLRNPAKDGQWTKDRYDGPPRPETQQEANARIAASQAEAQAAWRRRALQADTAWRHQQEVADREWQRADGPRPTVVGDRPHRSDPKFTAPDQRDAVDSDADSEGEEQSD